MICTKGSSRHQVRRDGLKEVPGPGLQRLREDRMVRIRADIRHDPVRFLLLNTFFCQKTDQLRDHQRRVRVVDLDRSIVGQVVEIASASDALFQDQLRSVAHHEILLIDAEQFSCLVAVVRVEEKGEVLRDLFFVKVDAGADQPLVDRVEVEQAQAPALAAVAGDVDLIHRGDELEVAALHFVVPVGASHPVGHAPLAPVIRARVLLVVLEGLLEQAAVVSKAHAVRGKAERREAVDETGREPAEAAVPERRLVLEFLEIRDVEAGLRQLRLHVVIKAEVDEVVGKEFSDQELRGNVVDFLLAAVVALVFAGVLRQGDRGVIEF